MLCESLQSNLYSSKGGQIKKKTHLCLLQTVKKKKVFLILQIRIYNKNFFNYNFKNTFIYMHEFLAFFSLFFALSH